METNCGEISNLHFIVYQAFSACLTMMNGFGFGLLFFSFFFFLIANFHKEKRSGKMS